MSKEIDLIKCIISEIDNNLYSDFGGNPCISYTSNLKKLLLALDTPEVRDFFENYEQQSQRIAELEKQLKEKDLAIDKFSKIDIWLMRKYGKKLCQDFNITNDDIDIKTFIKISQVFDNIYEEMNKEMPLMWFNYGFFFGLPKLDKGE